MQVNKKDGESELVITVTFNEKGQQKMTELKLNSLSTGFRDNRILSISRDNSILACADKREIKLYDLNSLAELYHLTDTNWSHVNDIAFSPDSKTLAVSLWGQIKLIDINSLLNLNSEQIESVNCKEQGILCLSFSPYNSVLAYGTTEGTVNLFDLETRNEIANIKGHSWWVDSLCFSPDGKTLLSSGSGEVKVWDTSVLKEITLIKGGISGVFSPDGKSVATANDCCIDVWDVTTWQKVLTFKGHNDEIRVVTFSPDGSKLVSASRDRTIKIWDISNQQEIATLWGHLNSVCSVVCSPDGKTLASGSWQDKTVKLWRLH